MSRSEGRPRDAEISRALVRAAERRMEDGGYSELTIDGLASDVGTTRQTVYRRYRHVSLLALEALQTRFGGQEEVDTGHLELDLLELQRIDVAMMGSPLLRKSIAGLFQDLDAAPEARQLYRDQMIGPRRANVAAVLEHARKRGEITRDDIDPEYICDLLVGPLLARILLPTDLPLDDRLARQTVATVLREIA